MQKLKLLFVPILLGMLSLALFSPLAVNAADFKTTEGDYTIEKGQVIEDDLYIGAEDISIEGIVVGDIFAGGNSLVIDGSVDGDVYFAGKDIVINGTITGSVFGGFQNMTIGEQGEVFRNMYVAGQSLDIEGSVFEDVFYAGNDVTVDGVVGDDLRVTSSRAVVNGRVNGDLLTAVGNLQANSENVLGEIIEAETDEKAEREEPTFVQKAITYVFSVLGFFLLLVAVYKFMPVKLTKIVNISNKGYGEILKAFLIGSGFFLIVPGLIVGTGAFGIVFPRVLLMSYGRVLWFIVILFMLVALLSKVVAAYMMGGKLSRKFGGNQANWLSKAAIATAFWAVLLIMPFWLRVVPIGFLSAIGAGLIIIDKFRKTRQPAVVKNVAKSKVVKAKRKPAKKKVAKKTAKKTPTKKSKK